MAASMPRRGKGIWYVRAGLLPGQPEPEYSRDFLYTDADLEADIATPADQDTIFVRQREAAFAQARRLMDPARLNWVVVEWVWL